jgi:hypothetical protein
VFDTILRIKGAVQMADRAGENCEGSQKQGKKRRSEEEQALHEQHTETAQLICEQLAETEEEPRRQIARIVKALGVDASLAFLQRTHEVEAAGGLPLSDGSRRRTAGGVFFYLVRHGTPAEVSKSIFPPAYKRKRQLQQQGKAQGDQPLVATRSMGITQTATGTRVVWDDRIDVLAEIAVEERGEVKSVKVTLVGRPGKVIERGQYMFTTMQQAPEKIPSLPKGLPLPLPDQIEPTIYSVYVSLKQWRAKKIAESLQDPGDVLIIEGFQLLDKAMPGTICVFASNVTTKLLQAAQKQAQQAAT